MQFKQHMLYALYMYFMYFYMYFYMYVYIYVYIYVLYLNCYNQRINLEILSRDSIHKVNEE